MFRKEILENRDVPALAKCRPLKRNRTTSLQNNFGNLNERLNEEEGFKALVSEEAAIAEAKASKVKMGPDRPGLTRKGGP